MDFLGLRNLTILSQALSYIKKTRGEVVDVAKIPLDDPEDLCNAWGGRDDRHLST